MMLERSNLFLILFATLLVILFAILFAVSFLFNLLIMSSSWNRTLKLQASMNSLFSFINISSKNLDNSEHDNAQSSSSNVAVRN